MAKDTILTLPLLDPTVLGTRLAVKAQRCPNVVDGVRCSTRFQILEREHVILDMEGNIIQTYKRGQLICDPCLRRNLKKLYCTMQPL